MTDAHPRAAAGLEPLARLRIPARPEALAPLRRRAAQALAPLTLDAVCVRDLLLVIGEACANVMRHAYAGRGDGEILVSLWHDGSDIVVRVRDFAPPVGLRRVVPAKRGPLRPGGLGVHLMRAIMDELAYSHAADGSGNLLEMRKRLSG